MAKGGASAAVIQHLREALKVGSSIKTGLGAALNHARRENISAARSSRRAVWVVPVMDDATRPAHAALNGVEFSWDEEPPLKADESSNGEDCFPGEDFRCRCQAIPVEDEADEDEG